MGEGRSGLLESYLWSLAALGVRVPFACSSPIADSDGKPWKSHEECAHWSQVDNEGQHLSVEECSVRGPKSL